VIGAFETQARRGTYWGSVPTLTEYRTPRSLPAPIEQTLLLAQVQTRLKRLDAIVQDRLMNWGYAVCDAAMRRWVDTTLPAPTGFPYPASGVG
jgi:NTE family protein